MQKVLLKKILFVNKVESKDGEDYVVDETGVIRELYGLFDVGPVSMRDVPCGFKFFDTLEELNEEFETEFGEDEVEDFDTVMKEKVLAREARLKSIGYYDE